MVVHLEAETETLEVPVPHHHPGNHPGGEQGIRHPQMTGLRLKEQKPFVCRYPEVVRTSSMSSLLEQVGQIGPVQ